METEAKFRIPDEETFQRLLRLESVAEFSLGEVAVAELLDHYLDTAHCAARLHGYACRIRQQDGSFLATLKGTGAAKGAIHDRYEFEVRLTGPMPPSAWPASTARDLALGLFNHEPLTLLFEIRQTRSARAVHRGDRLVGEMNLDRGRVMQGQAVLASFLELEIELMQNGTRSELCAITDEFLDMWGLMPERQSKYERAMALCDMRLGPDGS